MRMYFVMRTFINKYYKFSIVLLNMRVQSKCYLVPVPDELSIRSKLTLRIRTMPNLPSENSSECIAVLWSRRLHLVPFGLSRSNARCPRWPKWRKTPPASRNW